ncbi:MAG TPA: hypothetical protein VN258_19295 [Mobilitalea sp.]|nr:hypothetical protein [Mobilitalea sp.]
MDTKSEDKIVRQIEKSLSNNINENLFLTGRVFDHNRTSVNGNTALAVTDNPKNKEAEQEEYPLVSKDYISDSPITISRAEYIRQAREACLRQLSNTQIYSRPYDVNYMEPVEESPEQFNNKKAKAWNLFHEEEAASKEVDTPQEIASFRFLIIRTICAVVLFLTIFLIDKFEFTIGNLTPGMIQEYVTGNDSLQSLEDFIVTWLK